MDLLRGAELPSQGGQCSMQAALHGHGADIQCSGRPSVAPPLQHHPSQHLLTPWVQAGQQAFHPVLAFLSILCGFAIPIGELLQESPIQREGSAEHPMALQELPVLCRHSQFTADLVLSGPRC